MPGNIYYFTKRDQFKELLKSSKLIIVDFTASWCGPCKNSKPHIMKFFDDYKEIVDLVIVDVDKGPDLKSYMRVKSFPTFYSFVHGEVTAALVGFDEKQLKGFFDKTLNKYNNYRKR